MHRKLEDYANEWELRQADGRLIAFDEWPLARAVRGEFVSDAEIHYLHVPSSYRLIGSLTGMSVHDKQGAAALIVMTLQDIAELTQATNELHQLNAKLEQRVTERTAELRDASERIAAILATVVDGIITIDAQGRVQTFNPAAERQFGHAAAEVIGHNVKLLMPELYHGEHDGYLSHYHDTGEARVIGIGREVQVRRKDGSVFPLPLTDLHMPRMDGFELTAAIRGAESAAAQGGHRIPIIALTANALRGESLRCLAADMDDYLSKPTPLVEMKAMLEKWLPATVPPTPTMAPALATLDVSVLVALVGDDPATIRECLQKFRASANTIAAELTAACAAGQAAQAGDLAHKLKSSARSVGALALGEICEQMEQAGKAGNHEILHGLLPEFEREMDAVQVYLASLT